MHTGTVRADMVRTMMMVLLMHVLFVVICDSISRESRGVKNNERNTCLTKSRLSVAQVSSLWNGSQTPQGAGGQ
jgi:hypothetical protein